MKYVCPPRFALRSRSILASAMVISLLCACGESAAPIASEPSAANAAPAQVAAPAVAVVAPATSNAASASIGIAECDQAIAQYQSCMDKLTRSNPAAVESVKMGMETLRTQWTSMANDPSTHSTMVGVCQQTLQTLPESFKTMGCE